MYFEYRSISDLNRCILEKLYLLPRNIDLIVGIPRSGMLPANLMALYLNKPFTDIDSFLEGKIYGSGQRARAISPSAYKNIMIVDDSVFSGNALAEAKEKTESLAKMYNLRYAVVYATADTQDKVDCYLEIIDGLRFFQWNLFHHRYILENSCCDIDGVLCLDPPVDDDADLYLEYITHAIPLYVPTVKIGTLVSCRLEKYREPTVAWLEKYKIRYDRLVMLDLPDKQARQQWNRHAGYKAEVYKRSDAFLFIESSLEQARGIKRLSDKSVFCIENFSLLCTEKEKWSTSFKQGIKRRLPAFVLTRCHRLRRSK